MTTRLSRSIAAVAVGAAAGLLVGAGSFTLLALGGLMIVALAVAVVQQTLP